MFRSPFFWKLYSGYVVLIVMTTGIVILTATPAIQKESLAEIERTLGDKAVLLRSLVSPEGLEGMSNRLPERVRLLGESIHTRLTIIAADGTVTADSHEDTSLMDNHGQRPEILQAAAEGRGAALRFSRTLNQELMYVALPVRPEGEIIGFVRTALPLTAVEDHLQTFRRYIFLGAGLGLAIGLGLGFLFTRHNLRPLVSVTRKVESLVRDHSTPSGPSGRRDEIGDLDRSFHRMAEELRERMSATEQDQRQLNAILSGMQEGVVAVNRNGEIIHMNRVAGRILKVPAGEVIGRNLWEVTRVGGIGRILSRAMKEGLEITEEARWAEPDRNQSFQIHASPIHHEDATVEGAVAVLHDVTDLRRLETIRQDFVANVSHELKTPVTAIRGLVETLDEDPSVDPGTRKRFLGKVRRQSDRLSALLTDLLTLSRMESVDPRLDRIRLDLRGLLEDAYRNHLADAESKRIDLGLELPVQPVPLQVDRTAILQAVDNLVDNAIKYTPEGGHIRLRLAAGGEFARIEVEDDGPGIDPRDQVRIFERFYRVDKARSRELGGTGLGLSIVKHIAGVHGGDVSLESAPGSGSIFRIRLPLGNSRRAVSS